MLWLATRLHLFAMEGLEAVTALTHPKVMAAGVRQVGQELNLPADVKAWLKDLKAPERSRGAGVVFGRRLPSAKARWREEARRGHLGLGLGGR